MRYVYLFYGFLTSWAALAQPLEADHHQEIEAYHRHMETVSWLQVYDIVAWITADSLTKHHPQHLPYIGQDWFCYERNGSWHAAFGSLKDKHYKLLVHFSEDSFGDFQPTTQPLDTFLLSHYAIALQTARVAEQTLWDQQSFRYNQYILKLPDNTFQVWLLPAFSNGHCYVGVESVVRIDPTGFQIFGENENMEMHPMALPLDRTMGVFLDQSNRQEPMLSTIYVLWNFRNQLGPIHLETAGLRSTLLLVNERWHWVHTPKSEALSGFPKNKSLLEWQK
jgi:hypothetical protein